MCTDLTRCAVIVSAGLVIMMGSASTLAMQAVLPHLDECAQGCYFTAVNCMGDALAMLENQHQFHVLAACDLDEEACAAACGNVGSHTGVTANADAKVGCVWAQMLDGDECTCGPDGNQVGDTISCNDGSLTLWGGENEGHPTCVGVSFCTPWVQDNMRIIVGASIVSSADSIPDPAFAPFHCVYRTLLSCCFMLKERKPYFVYVMYEY